jgi:hypothetical protein
MYLDHFAILTMCLEVWGSNPNKWISEISNPNSEDLDFIKILHKQEIFFQNFE